MSKRRLDEDESTEVSGEGSLNFSVVHELDSEDMERIEDDSYMLDGASVSEVADHSDIEEYIEHDARIFGYERREDYNGHEMQNGRMHMDNAQSYDVGSVLKAQEVSSDFFDQEFFRSDLETRFVNFFGTFGSKKYVKKIRQMCSENMESIEVNYLDVEQESSDLVRLLDQHAERTIEVMNVALERVVKMHFPNYYMIKSKIHARITGLPVVEGIRALRNNHLGKLVRVSGVVTRRSGVFPHYSIMKFNCLKCKSVFGPFIASVFKPTHCFECQSKGPFSVDTTETIYKDFQKLTIQEIPGSVPPGSLPRSKDVLLFYDLIDCAKPGEEIEVTGVYKNGFNVSLNIKNGFPVFFTVIEASSVSKDEGVSEMTDEDIREIRRMGMHPDIRRIVVNSIAPSVYGQEEVKRAVALAMFGGVAKESRSHRIRGDINVLLLGDPGMAKSQFLRYVENTSHRAVLSTGQGASGVGLTASVRKDPVVKEWTLEGGALVLADRGVCLIDEFDKMNEHDRTSIHEAMEQQSISISKAGIVATLHARCSVIAAANPIRGRYNASLAFTQNVNLSDPIVSRFDILCVIKDVVDCVEDERTARFIIESHRGGKSKISGFDATKKIMSQELLRKYIMYARSNVQPAFHDVDMEKISSLYSELRKEGLSSGLPVTVRHVESIVRISEAFAKMRLSASVNVEDVDEAISVVLDSFMGAQKHSIHKSLRKKFMRYFNKSNADVLVFLLKEVFSEKMKAFHNQSVTVDEFERRAQSFGFTVPEGFYGSEVFKEHGFKLNRESRMLSRNNG
ncbi:minichromosome maintenance protein [Ordospora colligata]|uniref:DNA replication licensing factor MCM2 n=1 Tax=Ordospora colligata OC4 TaxID=1354746 RepID=A0A0B2ULL3_9MICR|nr:minichromosome maintenance protein [Ordospora colligata OC4]KHN69932.1 minichromosome maintenance protein [Ordospora colligata OC4]TBU16102.1 minichromosome maintenance protein [Ordospora colligata]TBU16315.1 minichromosome maintenance protein [Ordospora colligata]TBU19019.1 minichromosome maintenance protein [Ordospora colligata]